MNKPRKQPQDYYKERIEELEQARNESENREMRADIQYEIMQNRRRLAEF